MGKIEVLLNAVQNIFQFGTYDLVLPLTFNLQFLRIECFA